MCLILQRNPGFEIPYKKFEAAVINNPDGYGLSFPDDKGLTVLRSAQKPDPEKLYRFVNEELIDKQLMLHLRFTTAGATNLRNAHPFPILEKRKDGIDLRMAHNGTLSKYKNRANKDESDTRCFVRTYVRPLFKRLAKGMDVFEILRDPFTKELLEDQLSAASVLTFIDEDGNTLNCNAEGNGGKQEEEWYYSNTYSFDARHREPKSYSYSAPVTYTHWNKGKEKPKVYVGASNTKKFTEVFDVKKTEHLYKLKDETIKAIVKSGYPAEMLIKELLYEHSVISAANTKLMNDVKNLKEKLQ